MRCTTFAPRRPAWTRLLPLLLLGVLAGACRAPAQAVVAPAEMPAQTATSPALNPVLVHTVAAPQAQASFALLPPATETPVVPSATPTPLAGPQPTATPEATATPPPTFTPPALPNTPPWEHYWFWRPVPEGNAVWTDKAYPYGTTQGGTLRPHHGVEFNVGYNTEITASASGTVVVAGNDDEVRYGETPRFYGNLVVIQHDSQLNGQPIFTLYGHLNQVLVEQGQHVDARELIGLSGATGVADGPHLHFEVREGSNSYESTRNPLLWLYPFSGRGTVAGRVTWADGQPAREVPVSLRRLDAPTAAYYNTTTYADEGVHPDDSWNENFVLDDAVAGYYEVTAGSGENKATAELWVFERRTSFVELVLGQGAASGQ